MQHDLHFACGGGYRDAVYPEELEIRLDIVLNHLRVLVHNILVALARSYERIVAFHTVCVVLVVSRQEQATV